MTIDTHCQCIFACLHLTNCAGLNRVSEPKADPKEKELYSIKPLEWRIEEDRITTGTSVGFYSIEAIEETLFVSFDRSGYDEVTTNLGGFNSMELAKRQAQDHFNSKLKLCLNREL